MTDKLLSFFAPTNLLRAAVSLYSMEKRFTFFHQKTGYHLSSCILLLVVSGYYGMKILRVMNGDGTG